MELNAAICSDDNIICSTIKKWLVDLRPNYMVDMYDSGEKLLKKEKEYDLIYMDIEMTGMGGLQAAKLLREKKSYALIIFFVNHMEYMQEAFMVRAFRLLKKPVNLAEISASLYEAERELMKNRKIILELANEKRLVNMKDIACFEASGDGTYIYTKEEVLESNKPLRYWSEKMDGEYFVRVHRAYMVAVGHVKSVKRELAEINYVKYPVPVSRRKMQIFMKALNEYVKKYAEYL